MTLTTSVWIPSETTISNFMGFPAFYYMYTYGKTCKLAKMNWRKDSGSETYKLNSLEVNVHLGPPSQFYATHLSH